jgi:hypothetical protein
MLVKDMSRNIFFRFEYYMFYVLYPFVTYLLLAVITSTRPFRLFETAPDQDFKLLTRLSNCIE